LTINKNISLIGRGINQTIIEYNSEYKTKDFVSVKINSDRCKIQDLTITKNIFIYDSLAIYINSSNNIISNILITNFSKGIYLGLKTNNNIIKNNKILNNLIAIDSWGSSYNLIENNYIESNRDNGIYLHAYSEENTIRKNIAKNNYYGIMIKGSEYNKVYSNCFKENNYGAFVCCGSNFNSIYNNIFMNNNISNSQQNTNLSNYWYNETNSKGNYWDDYSGKDENQDGYGDTPYVIPMGEKQDIYPLISPPEDIICNI
jgi:parallel beta-helix repeat protein